MRSLAPSMTLLFSGERFARRARQQVLGLAFRRRNGLHDVAAAVCFLGPCRAAECRKETRREARFQN